MGGVAGTFGEDILLEFLFYGLFFSEEGCVYIQVFSEDDVSVILWRSRGGFTGMPGL